jgi:hypothetical protein
LSIEASQTFELDDADETSLRHSKASFLLRGIVKQHLVHLVSKIHPTDPVEPYLMVTKPYLMVTEPYLMVMESYLLILESYLLIWESYQIE